MARSSLLCSTRGTVVLLLWLCNVGLYIARTNISVAVLWMYGKKSNDALEGRMLAAFYVGYSLCQVPGGYLATHFGGKRVLACCVRLPRSNPRPALHSLAACR